MLYLCTVKSINVSLGSAAFTKAVRRLKECFMAIKVKAMERQLKVGKDAGQYRFMMQAEIYNTLTAQKVISEASVRSGIAEGALSAAWDAIGQVVKVWAGCHRTGSEGVGHRGSLYRHPWLGQHAIRRESNIC